MTAPPDLAKRLRECAQVFDVCRAHRPLNPEALADAGDWLGNAATEAAAALLREPEQDDRRFEQVIQEREESAALRDLVLRLVTPWTNDGEWPTHAEMCALAKKVRHG
jgi:hypothetical protein